MNFLDLFPIGDTYQKVKQSVSSVIRLEKCRVMSNQFRIISPSTTKNIFCLWRLDDYKEHLDKEEEKSKYKRLFQALSDMNSEMQVMRDRMPRA